MVLCWCQVNCNGSVLHVVTTIAQPTDDLAVKIEAAIPTATQASRDRFVLQMPLSDMSLSPCLRGHAM
jgi:hypothetical protein